MDLRWVGRSKDSKMNVISFHEGEGFWVCDYKLVGECVTVGMIGITVFGRVEGFDPHSKMEPQLKDLITARLIFPKRKLYISSE